MNRKLYLLIAILGLGIISACTAENKQVQEEQPKAEEPSDNQETTPEPNPEDTVATITQAEALRTIKEQLDTDLPIVLPSALPLTDGYFLTAITQADDKQVEIVFYESREYMPINDVLLKKNNSRATAIARLQVVEYTSAAEANEQIAFEDFSQSGRQKIDLGYDITGYQDAGAGSLWTNWNEGRWALEARTVIDNPEAGVELAKSAVEYLETHTLPIPQQHGLVHLDVYEKGNRIIWKNENIVYTIDSIKDPMKALEIATAFGE